MSPVAITDRIHAFVIENFLYARKGFVLAPETPLLQSGIIDSMGIIELIEFLEREFGIGIAEEEVTEANLGSVHSITCLVSAKRPGDVAA